VSEIAGGLLEFDAYCLRNKKNGGDNEYSDHAFGEISDQPPRFGDTRHSDGFGVRGLGAVVGIVAGFGLPWADVSCLLRGFIRLLIPDRTQH
jgi:hypothetical protein